MKTETANVTHRLAPQTVPGHTWIPPQGAQVDDLITDLLRKMQAPDIIDVHCMLGVLKGEIPSSELWGVLMVCDDYSLPTSASDPIILGLSAYTVQGGRTLLSWSLHPAESGWTSPQEAHEVADLYKRRMSV